MNRPFLRLAALLLPVLGLAALWGVSHVRAQQGTEWDVPVRGYDPRDLLRGHYIIYQYDWPGLAPATGASGQPFLCLSGKAPVIERVQPPSGFYSPSVFGNSGEPDAKNCPVPVRPAARGNLGEGRLYVPQDQAAALEEKLRDPALQGVVTIRLREDGQFTPQRISFRPRAAVVPPVSPPQ